MKTVQTLAVLLLASTLATTTQAQKKVEPTITVVKFDAPIKEAEFLKKNPSVTSVHWQKGSKITLELKDGQKELYILNNPDDCKAFIDKYGTAPAAPPPPPPAKKQ